MSGGGRRPPPEPGEQAPSEAGLRRAVQPPSYLLPDASLLGLMSATGLVLVYSLNTWLPELMLRAGFNAKGSLSFLLVLNGGAVIGALIGSRVADRFGPEAGRRQLLPASARSPSRCSRSASRSPCC